MNEATQRRQYSKEFKEDTIIAEHSVPKVKEANKTGNRKNRSARFSARVMQSMGALESRQSSNRWECSAVAPERHG
ncbi:MAG: hypothetical protein WCK32_08925 [Chlorobiaceae bacterium]